jgi:hypothetical protein
MISVLRISLCGVLLVCLAGCGKTDHGPAATGGHVHIAPHGGTLVEVGEHAYNLEILRDTAAGKLTAWVLDGHAENFLRIKAAAIEAVATIGANQRPLVLTAIANPATGETVGDTSQFEVQADWLKTATAFNVSVPTLEIRGARFENITFTFPPAAK